MSSLTLIDRLASFQVPEKPETSTHQLEATNTESQHCRDVFSHRSIV